MNREAIYSALFGMIVPDAIVTSGRLLRHWDAVDPAEMPALFQAQRSEKIEQTAANGLPTRWLLGADLYLYVATDGVTPPATVLNPLLDAIVAKLEPTGLGAPQTLGGLVQWARIDGAIETDEGTLGSKAVAIIPVRILAV